DPLGKFDKKSDEGYIIGYSIFGKAYRVYNLVSRKIEETMNLKFLENKPFVVGTGQAWMFNIDYLTNSLNYSRVSSTNPTAGSQVVPIVDEATTQNDGTKSDLVKTNADNLDELVELQALQRQEQAGTEEADRLGLAFPSLNLILGVGSASISSSISVGSTPHVSAGSTPPMSPCASLISAY
nr:retrovirus-related Pol polyprotein from transposon TNT 1-94 [Tanacetum cinerariifolium]